MKYELISEEDYENLPEDKEQCFVEIEKICRRNVTAIASTFDNNYYDSFVTEQYIMTVSASASACGVPNLEVDEIDHNNFSKYYDNFCLKVQREVARIRLRERFDKSFSVQIAPKTRKIINHHISIIRDAIAQSDLDEDRKIILNNYLDQLIEELDRRRLSFKKTMAVLAFILAGLSGISDTVTIAADAESAVVNIIKLIGIDKQTEDRAVQRLAPPPKALPAPVAKPSKRPTMADDLEDDIPF